MESLRNFADYMTENIDPRVADLPLISSNYQMPFIIFAYLYFVLGCGPRFMKNRSPYSLKTFIKFYDLIQIAGNAWLVYEHIAAGLFTNVQLWCYAQLDYSYNETPMRLTRCLWFYFMMKLLDYVETFIFVLRKKNNQVSYLHLYHHVSTSLMIWLGVRYLAVPVMTLFTLINSFVHVIMYIYYFMASFGSNIQKAIAPMKSWITIIQMIQFVGMALYSSQNFFEECHLVENWKAILFIGDLALNFYLFYNFYQIAYKKPKKRTQ